MGRVESLLPALACGQRQESKQEQETRKAMVVAHG
jgi:hypothetical protein